MTRASFRLGYNTNGLAHHRLDEALELLARIGYRAVAITPDVGALDPYRLDAGFVRRIRRRARTLDLALAVETGARFLLDPEHKHHPSLLDPSRAARRRRIDFLLRSVDLAAELDAEVVSIWSGAAPGGVTGDPAGPTPGMRGARRARPAPAGAASELWERLVDGLTPVLDRARDQGRRLGFEPEPGMFLERPTGYLELRRRLGERGAELGLTLDVGHLIATRDLPVPGQIAALAPYLLHVQLDDAPLGRHEHRMFGEGVLDLAGTLAALRAAGFRGMAAVELSRDSHRGSEAARLAFAALRRASRG